MLRFRIGDFKSALSTSLALHMTMTDLTTVDQIILREPNGGNLWNKSELVDMVGQNGEAVWAWLVANAARVEELEVALREIAKKKNIMPMFEGIPSTAASMAFDVCADIANAALKGKT